MNVTLVNVKDKLKTELFGLFYGTILTSVWDTE